MSFFFSLTPCKPEKSPWPIIEPGLWRLSDFDLSKEPSICPHEGPVSFDSGDGAGLREQYEGRSPEEELAFLAANENRAYQEVLKERGLPSNTNDFPPASTLDEAAQLLASIRAGTTPLWDGRSEDFLPVACNGIEGTAEIQIASLPGADPQVYNNTLLFCLEERVAFGSVWEKAWGKIWMRVWSMRQLEGIAQGRRLLVLTKDDGSITFKQSIEVAYLRAHRVKFEHMRIKAFLLQGRPLIQAAIYGRDKLVEEVLGSDNSDRFLQHQTFTGNTAAHIFAGRGRLRYMELALEAGAELEKRNFSMSTPLLTASQQGQEAVLALLLEARAAVNATVKDGSTPLHIAAFYGRGNEIKRLVSAGGKVDATMHDGATPLCVASRKGHEVAVSRLLEARAALDAAMEDGASPLFLASQEGHQAAVARLLEARASLCSGKSDGSLPLHAATFKKNDAALASLLEAQAAVDAATESGATALHHACQQGHEAAVGRLLDASANVDAATADGTTPLIRASIAGHEVVLTHLLDARADTTAATSDGSTALSISNASGHAAVALRLMDATAALDTAESPPGGDGLFGDEEGEEVKEQTDELPPGAREAAAEMLITPEGTQEVVERPRPKEDDLFNV